MNYKYKIKLRKRTRESIKERNDKIDKIMKIFYIE